MPRSADRIRLTEAPHIDELDAQIVQLARQITKHTYRLLMLVADFDERFGWARWGFRNCAEWLAFRCDLSLSAAREKVRVAHGLRLMPKVASAFAEGRLSYTKVRALTRVVEFDSEEQLLEYALSVTAPQVEDRCREMRNGNLGSAMGALRAWQRRSLTLLRNEARGVVTINVELPLDQGELVAQALERAVASGACATGLEFAARDDLPRDAVRDGSASPSMEGNGWRAQQADALVAVAKAYLMGGRPAVDDGDGDGDGESDGERGSERLNEPQRPSTSDCYQVIVHVDQSALEGHGGRSDLPIETVKRLTCDGSLVRIVEDDDGTPLDVGRKRRTVTTALRRALWARDRGCKFPGCRNKRYLEAHHYRHWASGGATKLANLGLFCTHHHTLLHEGGFRIRADEDGTLRFVRPDGRYIPSCGYRVEDRVDDYPAGAEPIVGDDTSMEGCCAETIVRAHTSTDACTSPPCDTQPPSMDARSIQQERAATEVRDRRGRYFATPWLRRALAGCRVHDLLGGWPAAG